MTAAVYTTRAACDGTPRRHDTSVGFMATRAHRVERLPSPKPASPAHAPTKELLAPRDGPVGGDTITRSCGVRWERAQLTWTNLTPSRLGWISGAPWPVGGPWAGREASETVGGQKRTPWFQPPPAWRGTCTAHLRGCRGCGIEGVGPTHLVGMRDGGGYAQRRRAHGCESKARGRG
jgi:hypothetical protein